MKVIQLNAFGGPEQLRPAQIETPNPGTGEIRIAVDAAGVGLMDVFARIGQFPGLTEPGFVPGGEVAGTVAAVGQGVDPSLVGKRGFAVTRSGGYAEQVIVPATALIRIPDDLASVDAVALGLNALVAHFSLVKSGLRSGETLIVRGASGGVGLASAVLAHATGATVTAVSSRPEWLDKLRILGIPHVLDRHEDNIPQDTYDVVVDPSGGSEIPAFLSALRPNGRYVLNGVAAGFPAPDFGLALIANFPRSLTFIPFSLDSIANEDIVAAGETLFRNAAAGSLRVPPDRILPLDQAAAAHVALEAGDAFGKLVLTP